MKRIAFIPARSGSKGLRDKNIKMLNGKPLIAYTIDAALTSDLFDRVIVSTDSEEYGDISRGFGAEVFFRDPSLADDCSTTYMVLEDLIKRINDSFDYFALLQPTSPLRGAHHILQASKLYEHKIEIFDFLVSVKQSEFCPDLVKPLGSDNSLEFFTADFANYRRQREVAYCPNGAIYFGKPDEYLKHKHFFGGRSLGFIMDKRSSVDIDDIVDFELASILLKEKDIL